MQSNDMVEKKRVKWDGNEIPGLVSVDEVTREKKFVEVPSFRRIREIDADIVKLPQLKMKYKVERSTNTLSFFERFFDENEYKDAEIIRTDAHGVEFNRSIWTSCACIAITEPAYDSANPEYASVTVTFVPYDRITV